MQLEAYAALIGILAARNGLTVKDRSGDYKHSRGQQMAALSKREEPTAETQCVQSDGQIDTIPA